MSTTAAQDRGPLVAAVDAIVAGLADLQSASVDDVTHPELLAQLDRLKSVTWALPAVEQRILARLASESDPEALGGTSLANVLATRMRISPREARRRIADTEDLGPRRALTGEPLEPCLAETAAAQARGAIGAEHVRIIRKFFDELPGWVDHQTREQIEATLGRIAAGLGPDELRQAADRLALLIDEDGQPPNDADRARKRFLTIGRQGRDGMSEIRGRLDPEARATLDAVLAKWASPGMCNPDDENPCVDDTPPPTVADRDMRSQAQRNHDALKAMGRSVLASGQLGQHNGLPCTIIASTTLQDLESGQGYAVTGGGTLLPMSDVIRMASHSHHYLSIFDKHTREPLYLGRTKRLASAGQRIVLHAKDRGCTFPGCTVPGFGCQVHHAEKDWADGGLSNITDETLACGPHNRLVEAGGWKTRKRRDGRTEWIPPPHLDGGQSTVNDYHHPENYLVDPDNAA